MAPMHVRQITLAAGHKESTTNKINQIRTLVKF